MRAAKVQARLYSLAASPEAICSNGKLGRLLRCKTKNIEKKQTGDYDRNKHESTCFSHRFLDPSYIYIDIRIFFSYS